MDLDAWKNKRNKTMMIYLLFGSAFGIDTTLIQVTILSYLKEFIPLEKATYFYSLSSIMFSLCATFTAIIFGRIVDKTRSVKYSLYFVLLCVMTGELLYTLRVSPLIIVFARATCGMLSSQIYVLRGEIIRCHDEEDASKVLWWYTAACNSGYVVGSWISLTFTGIQFKIGIWEISPNNFAGIFMAGYCFFVLLCVYSFAYDCSKEYDLKSYRDKDRINSYGLKIASSHDENTAEENDLVEDDNDERSGLLENSSGVNSGTDIKKNSNKNIVKTLYAFLRSPDILIVFASTLLYNSAGLTLDLLQPIVILNIFKWDSKYVNIKSGVTAIGMILIDLFLSKYVLSSRAIYVSSLVVILVSLISICVLYVTIMVPTTLNGQIILIVLYAITHISAWHMDEVILPNMLGNMVQTDIQSFAESCRSMLASSGCIFVGAFIAANGSLKYYLLCMIGLVFISFCIFLNRRKQLSDIRLIDL